MIDFKDYSHLFTDYSWDINNELKSWEYLKTFLFPNCVFFDIGCQRGMYSKAALEFTPNIHAFDVIKHPEIDSLPITFNQIALGDGTPKECIIHWDSKVSVLLDTVRLDTYKVKPDVIKIDLDCIEYECLLGASNLLSAFSPIIMIELLDSEFEKSYSLLSSFGYKHLTSRNQMNHFFSK